MNLKSKTAIFTFLCVLLSACKSTQTEHLDSFTDTSLFDFKTLTYFGQDTDKKCEVLHSDEMQGETSSVQDGKIGASPMVRLEPKYPISAARKEVEAQVFLSFDINVLGIPINIDSYKVILKHPQAISSEEELYAYVDEFKLSAKRTMARWRYKPATAQGVPELSLCHSVLLTYSLDPSA